MTLVILLFLEDFGEFVVSWGLIWICCFWRTFVNLLFLDDFCEFVVSWWLMWICCFLMTFVVSWGDLRDFVVSWGLLWISCSMKTFVCLLFLDEFCGIFVFLMTFMNLLYNKRCSVFKLPCLSQASKPHPSY